MNSFWGTDVGCVREINEDDIFVSTEPVGCLPNLFVVADGMGGHKGGEYASHYATENFVRLLKNNPQEKPVTAIWNAIAKINAGIYSLGQEIDTLAGMGTTMVVATIQDNLLTVANIGDSRLYHLGTRLRQITRDHSWVEEMISSGRLERGSDLYYEKKNVITRAVGASEQVVPDFFEVELMPGDRILLCSDGLTNMVTDLGVEEILKSGGSLHEIGNALIDTAKANGGKDNISVIIIDPELEEGNVC